jgi:ADP-L-glycero-D-manno-heptose 6-epimerase
LITGSSGFIGSSFKNRLRNEELILVDIKDCHEFLDRFSEWESLDLILHQGAISSTTEKDLSKLYEFNVNYSIRLMEKAIEFRIPIKYASSASVYGNHHPSVNPLSFYAISKLQVDYWVTDNLSRFSSVQGFRYFNVYGENEGLKGNQASPIFRFNEQAKADGVVKVFTGSGSFVRDFIWVEDVVDVVLDNNLDSGIHDLGTGTSVSFLDIANEFARKYSAKILEIDFPDHLKSQYQFNTHCINAWVPHKFMTVNHFISQL